MHLRAEAKRVGIHIYGKAFNALFYGSTVLRKLYKPPWERAIVDALNLLMTCYYCMMVGTYIFEVSKFAHSPGTGKCKSLVERDKRIVKLPRFFIYMGKWTDKNNVSIRAAKRPITNNLLWENFSIRLEHLLSFFLQCSPLQHVVMMNPNSALVRQRSHCRQQKEVVRPFI